MKIEVKNLGSKLVPNERIAIGFVHDSIKNNYLIESIKDELDVSEDSKILSGKSIIEDIEFIHSFVDYLYYNKSFIKHLKSAIYNSRKDKSTC